MNERACRSAALARGTVVAAAGLASACVGAAAYAGARPIHDEPVPHGHCFEEAAQRWSVNEQLLWAIARVESSFKAGAQHSNRDGTHDVGVMQVNSTHLPRLAAHRIDEEALRDPCTNIEVGASILAGFVRQYGPTWRAVGAYGAGSVGAKEASREAYARRVAAALFVQSSIRTKEMDRPIGVLGVASAERTQQVLADATAGRPRVRVLE